MTQSATRRTYLDALRGIAVLIMIEAHVLDAWTRAADRGSRAFGWSLILGGFGAPLFLFLAGVAVAMSAGSKARRLHDESAASRAVQNRGLQIFALAFLFRFQSFVLSHAPLWTLLKVDVLNIMGPCIVAGAVLWGLARGVGPRVVVFAVATAAIVFATPAVRSLPVLAAAPDWLEGYVRPVPGLTNFTLFPWAAFVTAGAVVGVILDAARTGAGDRRANIVFGVAGLLLAAVAYEASFLRPLDVRSSFWTTSASFFFLRVGLMTASVGVIWLWEQRPGAGRRWSPLQLLGRTSLFVYWVHVELVYGLIARPLRGAFSVAGAWGATLVFCTLMLGLAASKDRWSRKYLSKGHLREKLSRQVQA